MPKILFQKRKKEQINKAMKGSYSSLFENRVICGLFSFIYSNADCDFRSGFSEGWQGK